MPKSLVRIYQPAKNPHNKEYKQAVNEFIRKMGGPNMVIEAIHDQFMSDNPIPTPEIPIEDIEQEDPDRSL
jgi:hypothetical protein